MTKKDYILIAKVFAGTRPNSGDSKLEDQWTYDIHVMADALERQNPAFDHDRFINACLV